MPRILVVDDEPDICQMIRRYAEHDGYETVGVSDGTEAVEICQKEDFDIIIMDVMMPDMDGYSACKRIREKKDIPVLMLSARGEEYDKLFGFEVGVDDYVTKPFSPKELMARIRVIIQRHTRSDTGMEEEKEKEKASSILKLGGLELDTLGRELYVDGEKTELTAKEYDILLYFMNNKGIVLSRDMILSAVWGYDYFGEDRTVDWQMKLLRNKLGKYREMIHTVRGVGYKFDE
ncbi:MAG: response regulator transcription factor [Lachnospiraceae bacterium]|nr:response regulator transcription factor [Lachnospiraceae bacterium]